MAYTGSAVKKPFRPCNVMPSGGYARLWTRLSFEKETKNKKKVSTTIHNQLNLLTDPSTLSFPPTTSLY